MSVTADPAVNTKANVCAAPAGVAANSPTCLVIGVLPSPVFNNGSFAVADSSVFNMTGIPDGSKVQDVVMTVPNTALPGTVISVAVGGNIWASAADGSFVALSGNSTSMIVATPASLVQTALNTWSQDPSQANYKALIGAVMAAQPLVANQ